MKMVRPQELNLDLVSPGQVKHTHTAYHKSGTGGLATTNNKDVQLNGAEQNRGGNNFNQILQNLRTP